MLWKKEMSRIRAVQMDNHKGLLDIRRMDRVPNIGIKDSCEVTKGIGKGFMKVFSGGSAMWREWRIIGLLRV